MSDELTPEVIEEGLRLQSDRAHHGRDAWEAFAAHASEHYSDALRTIQAQAAELERLGADLAFWKRRCDDEEKEKWSWRDTVSIIAAERDKWQGQWESVRGVCEQRDAAVVRAEQAEALAARQAASLAEQSHYEGRNADSNERARAAIAEARAAGVAK